MLALPFIKVPKWLWPILLSVGCAFLLLNSSVYAQKRQRLIIVPQGMLPKDSAKYVDSVRSRDIRKAVVRSALVPGWGQITNKEAWKVPLVYGAIAIPTYLFFSNISQYRDLRDAYRILVDDDASNDHLIPDYLEPLKNYPNTIRVYRNSYRRDVDYSVLFFLGMWGLNVADAAVFANLRDFDVTDNISMKIRPSFNPIGHSPGVQMVFSINKKNHPLKYLDVK